MYSEDEFMAAMICAMFFTMCTILLLIRNQWLKRKLKKSQRALAAASAPAALPPVPQPDPQIADLKERIKVLERITVEKEGTLAREFERLRERS